MDNEEVGPGLVAIPPPNPPSDIIQSALFLPISALSAEHRGRKIRTIGQYVSHPSFCVNETRVIAYDVKSSILLLAAIATQATGPLATILINTSTPLLGLTPALKPPPQDDGYSRPPTMSNGNRERQPLSLDRGEFVTVVGWLESNQSKLSSQVSILTRLSEEAIADHRSIWVRLIRVL
jgi:hypothetical protein